MQTPSDPRDSISWPLWWDSINTSNDTQLEHLPALIPLRAPLHRLRGDYRPRNSNIYLDLWDGERVQFHGDSIPWADLPARLLHLAMRKFAETGNPRVLPIDYATGEPTVVPHLLAFCTERKICNPVVITLGCGPRQWVRTVQSKQENGPRDVADGYIRFTVQRYIPGAPRAVRTLLTQRVITDDGYLHAALISFRDGEPSVSREWRVENIAGCDFSRLQELAFSTKLLEGSEPTPRLLSIRSDSNPARSFFHHSLWLPYEPPSREGLRVLHYIDWEGNWASAYLERCEILWEWEGADQGFLRPALVSMLESDPLLGTWPGFTMEGSRKLRLKGKIYAPTAEERQGLHGLIGTPLATVSDPSQREGPHLARAIHSSHPITPDREGQGYLEVEMELFPLPEMGA